MDKYKIIRIMLAFVIQYNLELQKMDVKKTFFYGDPEVIYMEQPSWYEVQKGQDMVCLLKKLLYGFKLSPR